MATITIKDLPESTELDRQAMLAIAGGSRLRAGAAGVMRPAARRIRLFDLAPGDGARQAAARPPSP
ncbi:MAG: hypothetical protein JWP72_4326 [Massilia sp.]|jgi:hypothetical protein|nr:hypothetical protein [Massilia sp.]